MSRGASVTASQMHFLAYSRALYVVGCTGRKVLGWVTTNLTRASIRQLQQKRDLYPDGPTLGNRQLEVQNSGCK